MFNLIYTRIKFYICFLREHDKHLPLLNDSIVDSTVESTIECITDTDIYQTIDL